MATAIMEGQLREVLNGDRILVTRDCVARAVQPSGVEVDCRGVTMGVWRWRNGVFELARTDGSGASVAVETVAEALYYTRETLCPDP